MKISDILNYIDNGHMALPEFQRGYVWGRDQVRGLFGSLYRKHPVGGLLVWATQSEGAVHRGEHELAPGVVKLLLDGQQRITSLYGVIRGTPPKFFDGNALAFTGLHFHLEREEFQFYQPIAMKDDPLWIDVSALFKAGNNGLGAMIAQLAQKPELANQVGIYAGRLSTLLGIADTDLHIEEITGPDMTIDVVVDIFNKVNSGGTKLSKGDLALAKICADWPEARAEMKQRLNTWKLSGYDFTLDWLLRSVNTVLTGEAKFLHLHNRSASEVQDALARASKHLDHTLNLIAGRLGLDHDRVLFGRGGIPVMARYLDQRSGKLNSVEQDKLLFWFAQAAMWGRFSGSTESFVDADLEALDGVGGGLDKLLDQLRLWHGGLRVEPGHFAGYSMGARFYPVLYMLTRMAEARDWGGPVYHLKRISMANLAAWRCTTFSRRLSSTRRITRALRSMQWPISASKPRAPISISLILGQRSISPRSKRVTRERWPRSGSPWMKHFGGWKIIPPSSRRAEACWPKRPTGSLPVCCMAMTVGCKHQRRRLHPCLHLVALRAKRKKPLCWRSTYGLNKMG